MYLRTSSDIMRRKSEAYCCVNAVCAIGRWRAIVPDRSARPICWRFDDDIGYQGTAEFRPGDTPDQSVARGRQDNGDLNDGLWQSLISFESEDAFSTLFTKSSAVEWWRESY